MNKYTPLIFLIIITVLVIGFDVLYVKFIADANIPLWLKFILTR